MATATEERLQLSSDDDWSLRTIGRPKKKKDNKKRRRLVLLLLLLALVLAGAYFARERILHSSASLHQAPTSSVPARLAGTTAHLPALHGGLA